jgi:hypothetical protein
MTRGLVVLALLATAPCKPEPTPTPTPSPSASPSATPSPGSACVMPSMDAAGYDPGRSIYYAAVNENLA